MLHAAILAGTLAATSAGAGAMDGRTGPETMTGDQLDIALMHLNDHLQAHYAQQDMLAQLDAVPAQDFVTVAVASASTPLDQVTPEQGAFGYEIGDGASLMLHLASFNEERVTRGDDLFIRIARAETGKLPGFDAIARDNFAGFGTGPIMNDPTLDAGMAALHKGLREFEERGSGHHRRVIRHVYRVAAVVLIVPHGRW